MSYLSGTELYAVVFLAVMSVLAGMCAVRLYQRVTSGEEAAMAKFQLQPARTAKEFTGLFYGNVGLAAGLLLYFVGAWQQIELLLTVGRAAFAVFAVLIFAVFFDWWRRL